MWKTGLRSVIYKFFEEIVVDESRLVQVVIFDIALFSVAVVRGAVSGHGCGMVSSDIRKKTTALL